MRVRKSRLGIVKVYLLLVVGLAVAGRSMSGQNSYGGIVGTVTDPTGADVPGATITLKSLETNATQTATSGSGGTYSFLNLNPGVYTETISHNGFTSVTRNQVEVTIGGSTRIDVTLSVGNVTENVTVDANSQIALQTDTSSLGGVVESKQVEESPLNGRNVNNLLDFIPGVVPGGGTAGNTVANGGSGSFQVGTQTQAIA